MPQLMRSRYLVGFGFAALLLALVGLAILLATRQFRSDSERVALTHEIIGRIEKVQATLLEGVGAQRSYLLTGAEAYLEQFERTRPAIRAEMAALSVRIRDPSQAALAIQLGGLLEQRLDSASEGVRIYAGQGLEAARAYTRDNRGLQQTQQIRQLMDRMRAREQELLDERTAASRQSATALVTLGTLGIPFSLAILSWIYFLLSGEVRERRRAEEHSRALNADLENSVQRLEQVGGGLRELSHYASLLQSCRNVPEALELTRNAMASLLPGYSGTVYLLRESQDYLEAEAAWGEHATPAHTLLTPQECWALRRVQPHALEDTAHGMACTHYDAPVAPAATACLPLTAQGTTLGFLFLTRPWAGPLRRLSLATAAAEQLSLALSNLRLQESLRQQSIRDALTGLYNRRYLEESLPRELARCQRRGLPLALVILDLDHFKAFNDTHGHDGGDALLATFGRLLQAKCRAEDIACRYGGEEFTLILPETDLETARRRAEEIRAAVASMTVAHLQREIGGVTVSIGVALAPDHAEDAPALHRVADAALYKAKRAGRNRIEMAGG